MGNKEVIGIVVECNPFHKGHEYFLSEIRKRFGDSVILAVMSGDFVERGEPAILSKYDRALKLIQAGVDIVIQLPVIFSTSSAEGFALGSLGVLKATGIVNRVVFGAERVDLELFKEAAGLSVKIDDLDNLDNPDKLEEGIYRRFRAKLESGMSYPKVRAEILKDLLEAPFFKPNEILGISYIKASYLLSWNSLSFDIIKRNQDFESAHSIRERLLSSDKTHAKLKSKIAFPDMLSDIFSYRLWQLKMRREALDSFLDVSNELSGRLIKTMDESLSFSERIIRVKTKHLSYARISRAFLHIILGIYKSEWKYRMDELKRGKPLPYLRVLAMSRRGKDLLGRFKVKPAVSLKAFERVNPDIHNDSMYRLDLFAAGIYRQLIPREGGEYREKVLVR